MSFRTLLFAFVLCAFRSLAAQEAGAEPKADPVARMPVRVIADKLVLRCELSTPVRRIPVNLFVDYDRACGLELHNQAANGMRVDQNGGRVITMHLPGFNIQIPRREHPDQTILDEFTKLYSKELGETACVGTIGLNILKDYHVTFDLAAGFIYLKTAREKNNEPPESVEGAVTTATTLVNDIVWLPVRLADKSRAALAIGSSRYDSVVDQDLCETMEAPAGGIGAVNIQDFDLSKGIAWRPVELAQIHPDRAMGVLGLGFLKAFRVEIDRVNNFARLTRTAPPSFPKDDAQFIAAMVEDEPDPLLAALEAFPKGRLNREAAQQLLYLMIDDLSADPQSVEKSLQWMDKTRIEDLRATEALTTMQMLLASQRPKLAIRAGEMGIESGRKDRYVESVHKLHAKVGELLLDDDRPKKAWEHLLSAAFGLPEDGPIKLNLGRFYESQNRYRRAFSSYIMAVIQPESGPQAVVALERLQKKMKGEALSVDLVDRMVQGKTYNFSAATKFEPDEKNSTTRCVLVEHFINAQLGRKQGESWVSFTEGGAMACEGILSHFPRSHVAVIAHHTPQPEPTALLNEIGMATQDLYQLQGPGVFVINGRAQGPGAQRHRRAEELFEKNKEIIYKELLRPTKYSLEVTGTLKAGVLKGEVVVKGPERNDVAVQILLAEKGVLYPGKGKVVVHRMVSRDYLTGDLEGVTYEPDAEDEETGAKMMTVDFRRKLTDISNDNEAFLEEFEENGGGACSRLSLKIDPRQVSIVAFLRDLRSGEILQAIQVEIMPEESKKP